MLTCSRFVLFKILLIQLISERAVIVGKETIGLMISDVIRKSLIISRSVTRHKLAANFVHPIVAVIQVQSVSASIKKKLDYSKVPQIKEEDLEEQFIHGSGPGGQAVNKAHNCVLLKHLPSGIVVKSHEYREAEKNRLVAREKLKEKLDELYNGENSISNQIKRFEEGKLKSNEGKKAKLRELKKQFKESQLEKKKNESVKQVEEQSDN